ncbi:hypothetical protein A8F94_09685 [Bacillus sp. FJAT-27225]|uniref:hypothetical protein n=1 Tax=Bacillus sp. FJAT-27225 TaxID=1743144 RepID=UPI00080C33D4|nr:hypothetical protein [Bacillus sp. FJAT-27225]OCA88080.1 hypothetical protein A8F94_09685 [Bacillus sp. FJAT-27225]
MSFRNRLTSYRKMSLSRNMLLIILAVCLVGVGSKIVLAHEKIATFNEADALYAAGKMRAAEEKFRLAKLNVSVRDHNDVINTRLAELSPIREMVEQLDEQAADYIDDDNLAGLVETEASYQEHRNKWQNGTPAEADMFGEMIAYTKLDQDLKNYFVKQIESLFAKLKGSLHADEELTVFNSLSMIPPSYYGGESKKVSTIEKNFTAYFSGRLDKLLTAESFYPAVQEGERQFDRLKEFKLESQWLFDTLDSFLLGMLTGPFDEKDYKTFVHRAKDSSDLEADMKDSNAFAFRASSLAGLERTARQLASNHKYEKAIEIYTALSVMTDYSKQIAALESEWDLHEPIRVLKRKYPDEKFVTVIDGRNGFEADSYLAAISEGGILYFGKISGGSADGDAVDGDWDGNGIADADEDRDGNGVRDGNQDSDGDGVPDSEEDKNRNGIPDADEDSDGAGTMGIRRVSMDVVTSSEPVSLPVKKLQFSTSFGSGPNPVIYFESGSQVRENRYVAYEVRSENLAKILDIEADGLKAESAEVLIADNPTGDGEGKRAYFALDYDGYYAFDKVLVDYVDIDAVDLASYKGKKVRLTETVEIVKDGYGWAKVNEVYDEELGHWVSEYVLIQWNGELTPYWSYTFIGTYTKNAKVTDENLLERSFPVLVVEEVE